MLANHGTVLDLQNIYGNTALMLASGAGQLETALELLLLGADASKKTDDSDDGKTAENVAYNCHHRSLAFMIYLWNEYHKDFNKLMFNYAVSGIDAAFRRLIDQGGDINYTNEDGRTGFAMAAARGHVAVVRTYLKNGMDVHTRSGQDQQTALAAAVLYEQVGVVCELLEWGADPNVLCEDKPDFIPNGRINLLLGSGDISCDDAKYIGEVLSTASKNGNIGVSIAGKECFDRKRYKR